MKVNWYRERFSGTSRYCRADRRDFVVGIQRDKSVNRFLADIVTPNSQPSVSVRNVPIPAARQERREEVHEEVHAEVRDTPREERRQPAELPRESQNPAAAPALRTRPSIAVMPSRDVVSVTDNGSAAQPTFNRRLSQNESNDSPPPARFQFQSPRSGNPKGRENMANKWSDLAPWRQKQAGKENDTSASDVQVAPAPSRQAFESSDRDEKSKSNSNPAAPSEAAADANPIRSSPGDLLSMDDIYRAAGILAPRMGYSIRKVADMLASDHLRGVSDEMKRASVLMARDAAGISVDEVLRDAAMRQSAINS